MTRPSRRQLLAGAGSALLAGTAGCTGFDVGGNRELERAADDGSDEGTGSAWEMPDGLPEGLTTALRFVFSPAEDAGFPGEHSDTVSTDEESSDDAIGTETPPSDETDSPLDGENSSADWLAITLLDHQATVHDPELTVSRSDVLDEDDRIHADTELRWELQLNLAGLVDGAEARTVWVGDIVVDTDATIAIYDEFQLYDVDDQRFATDGEVGLLGEAQWVEETIARVDAGEKPYVVQYPRLVEVLSELETGAETVVFDNRHVVAEQFGWVSELGEPETLTVSLSERPATGPTRRRTHTFLGYYPDGTPDGAADALTELADEIVRETPDAEELTTDGQLAKLLVSSQFVPPENRLEPPGNPVLGGYDAEENMVEFVFQAGDEIDVEYLSLEIESEPYEGEWVRGQKTLGKGDSIVVAADAVEPGDDLTLRYEHPEVGVVDGTSNTVLTTLPFEYVYDPDTRELTATYGDGPPLPADRLSGGPFLGDQRDFTEQVDGELRMGKNLTLTDIDRDNGVELRYERSDARIRAIAYFPAEPPGSFAFEREGETLTLTYSTAEPVRGNPMRYFEVTENDPPVSGVYKQPVTLTADRYEIRADGTPTERQWVELGDQIEEGDSLVIEAVEFGEELSIVWMNRSGHAYTMDTHVFLPKITFEAEYHESVEAVTLSHAGGETVASGGVEPVQPGHAPVTQTGVEIQVYADESRLTPWPGEVVAPGDSVLVTNVPVDADVALTIGNAVLVAFNTRRLRDADEPVARQTREQADASGGGFSGVNPDEVT